MNMIDELIFFPRENNSGYCDKWKERKHYYAILEKTQKGKLDITPWIKWFLGCLERAIEAALSSLDTIVRKSQFWEDLAEVPLNERQRKVINRLLGGLEGKLTSSKWAKMTKCSQDTAYRDILDLLERGILTKNSEGGRSTSYSLAILKRISDKSDPNANF